MSCCGAGRTDRRCTVIFLVLVSSRRLGRLVTQKSDTKMKTPEAFAPGVFRMSLQLTGSPSPFSIRWGCEFPRFLHPALLLPAPSSRVSSCPKLFGSHRLRSSGRPKSPLRQSPPDASSGCPDSYIFRLAYGESPGHPGPSLRLRRHPANFQVSPAVAPSGSTGRLIFRSPRISLSGVAANASPGFPGSCVRGWVDDEPGQPELCILQRSRRMNLRVQSGVAYSTGLKCLPDFASSLHVPDKPACQVAQRNRTCIVLPESNCLPNSLQVHQLETELRAVRAVNASVKVELICGFHKLWCICRNILSSDQDTSRIQEKPGAFCTYQVAKNIHANY